MKCPKCGGQMILTTQYVGSDGKIVRVYTCSECGNIAKG